MQYPIPARSFSIHFIFGGISIVLQLFTKFFKAVWCALLFYLLALRQSLRMRSIDGCSIRRGTLCVDANLYGADLQNAIWRTLNLPFCAFWSDLTEANLNETNLSVRNYAE